MCPDRLRARIPRISELGDDHLLTPREVAEIFGVRTTTVARWVREGLISALTTPGGHRRYRLRDVRAFMVDTESGDTKAVEGEFESRMAEDAVRLYEQGWSIRQVAAKFDVDYTKMRRLLQRNGVRFRR